MMENLLSVSLRQKAVFIPQSAIKNEKVGITSTTATLVANLAKLGFGVSEELLNTLNQTNPTFKLALLNKMADVMGMNKNWTPLVKGWDVPTGEDITDHLMTFFANIFGAKGTKLACGHIIPAGTFPLERYNGCPFCGTPFEKGEIEITGQGTKLKVLELWTEKELNAFFEDLLTSKTALDATQIDSLKFLLAIFNLPKVNVGMKETLMLVIDTLIAQNQPEKAQVLFNSPTDILRYLWFKKTGFLQIIEPKTLIQRKVKNYTSRVMKVLPTVSAKLLLEAKNDLKLNYSRQECLMVAKWLNGLEAESEKICEMMHPKRNMWVRFIRALRLPEYSKKVGFEKLKEILDKFYKEDYEVWQGRVNFYRLRSDEEKTLKWLKQRPGLFARSLFANMLWFGAESVVNAFAEIIDKVPARLVFTLNMYANNYFDARTNRTVRPLGSVAKSIPPNRFLNLYNEEQLKTMKQMVESLCELAVKKRFALIPTQNKTIYIEENLFKIPLSIGDRSENVQDLPSALMGTRFAVQGNKVRLFMQWGTGLPAQHLDMDLSCHIAYANGKTNYCSYSNLSPAGCKHSGDIIKIPDKIGTAEYIEIDVAVLQQMNAKYVTFTCNAYSNGSITPNLVVGWMDSKDKMHISEKTGVAYDPSCVQHQVRITSKLTKGLVFGVLDVMKNEIIWLELPFGGQTVGNLDVRNIDNIVAKLSSKLSIGNLLLLKAQAQNLMLVDKPEEADEAYDMKWGLNTAAVTKLFVD